MKSQSDTLEIGIDEAGRGPWAGPIVAAAAATPDWLKLPPGITDSKLLGESQREALGETLRSLIPFGIGECSASEIDSLGLGAANRLVFERAFNALIEKFPGLTPGQILCDGTRKRGLQIPGDVRFVVKGELKHREIAAASILAKTHRDGLMRQISKTFPAFGFSAHKGYGTAAHLAALKEHGPIAGLHRMSFKPIAALHQ